MKRPTQPRCNGFPAALAAIILLALVTPRCALGDGGFMPPYGKDIWEPSQKALILYDEQNETEDLILQADFEGDTEDFAWIVPVPSLPTLEAVDYMLFYDCARLTRPLESGRGIGSGCFGDKRGVATPGDLGRQEIEIYERQTVGIYETMTIGADDPAVLADSLESWGYLHEANRISVEEALQFYIDKSWYFVTMKIDSSSVGTERHGHYWLGPIHPIRLTFVSPQIVYPMRISAISAKDPCEVLIYVCAPHRMTFPRARTEYANRLNESELLYLQDQYRYLGEYITEPLYMTKLRRSFSVHEMDDDLILERAPTDDEFRDIYYAELPFTELLFLLIVGVIVMRSWLARKKECAA